MLAFVLLSLLLILGPLAYFAGVDSRIDDVSRRHPRL
jgi:hypothetical protein